MAYSFRCPEREPLTVASVGRIGRAGVLLPPEAEPLHRQGPIELMIEVKVIAVTSKNPPGQVGIDCSSKLG